MSWKAECKRKAKALSPETRRECIRRLWDGESIGEVGKKGNITRDEVIGVIELNTFTTTHLRQPEDVR